MQKTWMKEGIAKAVSISLRRSSPLFESMAKQLDTYADLYKIWHGSEYNERGEQGFTEYLDYYHKDKGYMLSFNFDKNKEIGVKEIQVGDKMIVETVV